LQKRYAAGIVPRAVWTQHPLGRGRVKVYTFRGHQPTRSLRKHFYAQVQALECLTWVNRVILPPHSSLPIYSYKQTISETVWHFAFVP
jgi:hypothetical protein